MSEWQTHSGNGSAVGAVERLSIEPLPEKPRRAAATPLRAALAEPATLPPEPAAAPAPPPEPVVIHHRPSAADLITANLAAIAKVLAIRLQLLLALFGAFALAIGAMQWQSNAGLAVLVAWCLLTILPLVGLEYSGRPRR